MPKALIFVGTRPEAIKLIPVYKSIKRLKGWKVVLASTGQHREMLLTTFKFFGVKPDIELGLMTANQQLDQLTSRLIRNCSSTISGEDPSVVIVQGDTTTAMIASMAAFYLRVPVAHIEAGLRSYDNYAPYPEEMNRRIISLVAHYHFAPTKSAAKIIMSENCPGKIFVVGNTVIDSLLYAKERVQRTWKALMKQYSRYIVGYTKYILITGHRRESFGGGFESICKAIRILARKNPNVSFVYPVHMNPHVQKPVHSILKDCANVYLLDPVPYDHMVFLMMGCTLIMTDSGGVQEEAPTLGKPVVVMRTKTERPEGVAAGCSILSGTETRKITRLVSGLLSNRTLYRSMTKGANPYGSGDSADRIAKILNAEVD